MEPQPLLKPRLKSPGSIPYGGEYSLNLPALGMVGRGTNFHMLVDDIRTWRKANGLPNGLGLNDEIERQICLKHPAECKETDERIPQNRPIGFGDVIDGTKVMADFKLSGSPLVSQEEANSRAAICVSCYNNRPYSKPCGGICGALKDMVLSLVGANATEYDGRLNSCAVCHCFLAASVWLPIDIQTRNLTDEQRVQFQMAKELVGCWKSQADPETV